MKKSLQTNPPNRPIIIFFYCVIPLISSQMLRLLQVFPTNSPPHPIRMDPPDCPPLWFHIMTWSHKLTRDWPQGRHTNQSKFLLWAESLYWVRTEQQKVKNVVGQFPPSLFVSLSLSFSSSLCPPLMWCAARSPAPYVEARLSLCFNISWNSKSWNVCDWPISTG